MKDGRTSLGTRGSKHAATGIGASLQQPEALSCLFGGTVLLVLDAAMATIQWSPDYTCFCLAELLVLYTIGGLPYKPLQLAPISSKPLASIHA